MALVLVKLANDLPEDLAYRHFRAPFPGNRLEILRPQASEIIQGCGPTRLAVLEEFLQVKGGEIGYLLRGMLKAVVPGGQPEFFVPSVSFPYLGFLFNEELNPHVLHPKHVPK